MRSCEIHIRAISLGDYQDMSLNYFGKWHIQKAISPRDKWVCCHLLIFTIYYLPFLCQTSWLSPWQFLHPRCFRWAADGPADHARGNLQGRWGRGQCDPPTGLVRSSVLHWYHVWAMHAPSPQGWSHHAPHSNRWKTSTTGPLFTNKTPSYQYRNSHYKPETVVRPS